jgi:hypothetical protein
MLARVDNGSMEYETRKGWEIIGISTDEGFT